MSQVRASCGSGSCPCMASSGSEPTRRSQAPAQLVRMRATMVVAINPAMSPMMAPAAIDPVRSVR